jgi:hypothetical protein
MKSARLVILALLATLILVALLVNVVAQGQGHTMYIPFVAVGSGENDKEDIPPRPTPGPMLLPRPTLPAQEVNK